MMLFAWSISAIMRSVNFLYTYNSGLLAKSCKKPRTVVRGLRISWADKKVLLSLIRTLLCDIITAVMHMQVISLASSSVYGNAYLIGWGPTTILVDCGVPLRRLEKNLYELGIDPRQISAAFITHEHSDHIRALQLRHPFPERYGIKVFAPKLFWYAAEGITCLGSHLRCTFEKDTAVDVGMLRVEAFSKSHDAVAPLGFRITSPDGTSAVIVTDLGEVTPEVMRGAFDCDYIVWESNHDRDLELSSGRPYSLIKRVLGREGHLSNDQAGLALASLVTERTKGIMLAHLSLDCNTPELAVSTVAPYLRRSRFGGLLTVAQAGDVTVLANVQTELKEA